MTRPTRPARFGPGMTFGARSSVWQARQGSNRRAPTSLAADGAESRTAANAAAVDDTTNLRTSDHAGGLVSIMTRRFVPDSPPQAWPGLPSIWRTLAFGLSLGNAVNFSVAGLNRTMELEPKSVHQTMSSLST